MPAAGAVNQEAAGPGRALAHPAVDTSTVASTGEIEAPIDRATPVTPAAADHDQREAAAKQAFAVS